MRRFLSGRLTAAAVVVFACLLSYGQESRDIKGAVTDSSGASITNATITVVRDGAAVANAVTDEDGRFRIEVGSPEGIALRVSAKGFERRAVRVSTDQDRDLRIVLEPARIAAIVSVEQNYLAGTEKALTRIPGSVEVITAEQLDQARAFNFSEALRKISGVNVRNEEGFGLRPNISIRGSDPTRSRKVLILEDGIPLSYAPYGDNSSYYHPPVERFESIEVLKGSGQIEYGPVTVAGVVNYITPDPFDVQSFRLELTGGNRDFFNGTARYSGTIGTTGVVASFTRKQGEGSRVNLRSGINDLSFKVHQPIGASNHLVFKYSHFNEDSRLTYSGLTEEEFAEDPRQNPFRNDDLDFFREGFSVSHTGIFSSSTSVTTNFYTSYFSRDWWRQSSNSTQRPNRLGSDPDCLGMQDLNTTCGNQGTPRDFRVIGVEPKFNGDFDLNGVRSEFTAGFRAHYETQFRRAYIGDLPNSREGVATELNKRNSLAFAGFVQNRFIFERFSVTPGVRIENVGYERSNLLNGASAATSITQVIPGIGATFNLTDTTTVFSGLHRGFAPPSTADILTNSGGVVELDAELSWNFEAGVRSRPADGFELEAVFFRNDFENQIIPASVAGGTGAANTNAGATLQQGIEFVGRLDSGKIFKTGYNAYVRSSLTYLANAEFRGVRNSSVSGFEGVSVTGNRLPYTPRYLATTSAGLEYRSFNGFVENVYIGSQFSDDLNSIAPIPSGQRGSIGAQKYFNLTANYRFESVRSSVFFTVKNLFDSLYIVDRTRGIYPSSPRLVQAGVTIDLWK